MSILKLFRGNKLNIDQTPVTDGQMYLSKDTNELIVDTDDGRVTVQDGRVSGKLDRIEGTDSVQKVYAVDTNGTQIMKAVVDDPTAVAADVAGLTTANAVAGAVGNKVSKSGDTMTGTLVFHPQGNKFAGPYTYRDIDGKTYRASFGINVAHNAGIWLEDYDNPNTYLNAMLLKDDSTYFQKPVSIESGGTGATTADAARANLNAAKKPEVRDHSTFACVSNGNEVSRELSDTLDYQVDSDNYTTVPTTKLVSDSLDTKQDKLPISGSYVGDNISFVFGYDEIGGQYVTRHVGYSSTGDDRDIMNRQGVQAMIDAALQNYVQKATTTPLDTYSVYGVDPSGNQCMVAVEQYQE